MTIANINLYHRDQLNQCRATISNLSYEENKLNEDIQRERDNKNVYVYHF